MRTKSLLLCIAGFFFFAFTLISPSLGTVVDFDDLTETASGSFITNLYQGLTWTNFKAENAVLLMSNVGTNGYYYGMVSASNNAFNALGDPAEIDSSGTNFNFLGAYLTGAWNNNLNIEVQGFRGASLVYSQMVVASATSPTLFTFNYLNVDRLTFSSSGGQSAGFPFGGGEQFAMDNFTFQLVPEPSSLLLAALGVLTLWPLLKRRRP